MTFKNELKQIYKDKSCKIQQAASQKGSIMLLCETVGNNMGYTKQTIYNYINGNIGDGYVADRILKEIKKYKVSK